MSDPVPSPAPAAPAAALSGGPLGWREKLAYGLGDTACCLFWVLVANFLNKYYTDVFGLAPAAVGLMLLVTRFWDAAFDLVVGMFADRTNTRWGKFRPWILWCIGPFIAIQVALFHTPELSDSGKLVYAYITYSLTMLIYSAINVPYGALLGVITPHSHERTQLAAWRFVGAFAGSFIVQGALLFLVRHLGQGDNRTGYTWAVTVLAVAGGLLFVLLFAGTRERVQMPPEKSSIRADLRDLSRNRVWLMLFALSALTLIYLTSRQTVAIYYFDYYVGNEGLSASFMTSGTLASIAGAMASPLLVRLIGNKRRAFIVLTLLAAAINGATYFAGPQDLVFIYAGNILSSFPIAALFPLMGSMYADAADYGVWKFGRRATGLVFAGSTFSQKTGGAVGAGLVNLILQGVGYMPNATQSAASIAGLRHMMSTIPALGGLVVAALALLYPLNAALEQQVSTDLAARSPGGR